MADINELITLGIGTPSDIAHFVLVGLSPNSNPPIGAQSPAASRYRYRYKVNDVIRFLILFLRF